VNIERRLKRLEGYQTDRETSPLDAPSRIRAEAERINSRNRREGEEPVFEITPDGRVFTLAEPRLAVTTYSQILAQVFYSWELEWHAADSSDLVFDPDAEEFRTLAGDLALSRTYVNLSRLMGEGATPID
jgi:hypothetical protein